MNVGDLGKLIVAKGLKNCPILSHWLCHMKEWIDDDADRHVIGWMDHLLDLI